MNKFLIAVLFSLLLLAQLDVSGSASRGGSIDRLGKPLKTTLRLEVNLYYGDEDERADPVDADFYLLDKSLPEILKSAGFKPIFADEKKHPVKEEDYLEAAAKILSNQSTTAEDEVLAFLIDEAVVPQQAAFAHTNQNGRGYFKNIKPGNYFLFGIKRIDDQIIVWHQAAVVKSGSNSIRLDQNDAAVIFSNE